MEHRSPPQEVRVHGPPANGPFEAPWAYCAPAPRRYGVRRGARCQPHGGRSVAPRGGPVPGPRGRHEARAGPLPTRSDGRQPGRPPSCEGRVPGVPLARGGAGDGDAERAQGRTVRRQGGRRLVRRHHGVDLCVAGDADPGRRRHHLRPTDGRGSRNDPGRRRRAHRAPPRLGPGPHHPPAEPRRRHVSAHLREPPGVERRGVDHAPVPDGRLHRDLLRRRGVRQHLGVGQRGASPTTSSHTAPTTSGPGITHLPPPPCPLRTART